MNEEFSMVQEAIDSYAARELPDGRLEIQIIVPRRFADLWLVKLSELRVTEADLDESQTK
jgi:hypothetical protein